MPSELEELVEFLHHGNADIRKIAIENLVAYSQAEPAVFKTNSLKPLEDLKLLVKDYEPISRNALTILINLSEDPEVLQNVANDEAFQESLMLKITNEKEPNANEISMLLANIAKSDDMRKMLRWERAIPKDAALSTSPWAIDQLMDCFVKGVEGRFNNEANFDYLSYVFADLAKHPEARAYFTTPQKRDSLIIPITKLTAFTEHASIVRRRGVASTIKNICFKIDAHHTLLSTSGVNILPYVLLPLMGPEDYPSQESDDMPTDVQLLPPDKKRDRDLEILKTHLESLLLLTTTREGRDIMKKKQVYAIVRECHAYVEDESVRDACNRFVQVVKRDEECEGENRGARTRIEELPDEDDEDRIVDVF